MITEEVLPGTVTATDIIMAIAMDTVTDMVMATDMASMEKNMVKDTILQILNRSKRVFGIDFLAK